MIPFDTKNYKAEKAEILGHNAKILLIHVAILIIVSIASINNAERKERLLEIYKEEAKQCGGDK